jgi:hypothetical protein
MKCQTERIWYKPSNPSTQHPKNTKKSCIRFCQHFSAKRQELKQIKVKCEMKQLYFANCDEKGFENTPTNK